MGAVPEHLKKALLDFSHPNKKYSFPEEEIWEIIDIEDNLIKGHITSGKLDTSDLVLMEIVNKQGKRQKVWVNKNKQVPKLREKLNKEPIKQQTKAQEEAKKPKKPKKQKLTPEEKERIKEEKFQVKIEAYKQEFPHLSEDSIKLRMKHQIPMAATSVKIYDNDPKLTCEFRDEKGRLQKRYTQEYQDKASKAKFERIRNLQHAFPEVRTKVDSDLGEQGYSKEKICGVIVKLIDKCYFRIGNEKYTEDNGTYGVSTLRKDHLKVEGNTLQFSYVGKKSVDQHKVVSDEQVTTVIKGLLEAPGDNLFQYQDKNGDWKPVTNRDVRKYLSPWGLKPKDFRTYHANRICSSKLAELGYTDDKKEQNNRIKEALEFTAGFLGHTPEICRRSYVNGEVLNAYRQNNLMKDWGNNGFTQEFSPEEKVSYKNITDKAYKSTIENDGVTIDLKGNQPTKGYAFAPRKDTETMVPEAKFNTGHIDAFVDKYAEELAKPGNHLGIWVDDGNVYLDISRVGEPSEETIKEAEKAGQLAVFNLETFETIYTKLGGGNSNEGEQQKE